MLPEIEIRMLEVDVTRIFTSKNELISSIDSSREDIYYVTNKNQPHHLMVYIETRHHSKTPISIGNLKYSIGFNQYTVREKLFNNNICQRTATYAVIIRDSHT